MNISDEEKNSVGSEYGEIEVLKREFIDFLKDEKNTVERIMNKYLLFGIPYIYRNDENRYFELKEEISNHFKIQQTQVYIVGSAKLGFSISPSKMFRELNDDSDIDVAIIDNKLFDEYWKNLYSFNINLVSRSTEEDRRYKRFVDYFFRGWVRPDLMPVRMSNEWFEYFKILYGKYNRKVAVGIYKDNEFFMGYHRDNILRIRKELKNGI